MCWPTAMPRSSCGRCGFSENKIVAERLLWIAVLSAQRDLGVDFGGDDPDSVIDAYTAQVEKVDLASIAAREKVTKHDVKARIEEFNALAGYEHVHKDDQPRSDRERRAVADPLLTQDHQ